MLVVNVIEKSPYKDITISSLSMDWFEEFDLECDEVSSCYLDKYVLCTDEIDNRLFIYIEE